MTDEILSPPVGTYIDRSETLEQRYFYAMRRRDLTPKVSSQRPRLQVLTMVSGELTWINISSIDVINQISK